MLVDGSQAAVHLPVDVQDLDADFYVFTGHKTYGPSGIGVLYGKKKYLETMQPYEGGGDMIELVEVDRITYGKPPHRFEAGTPAIVEAVGLGAALSYMMQVGRDRILQHEAAIGDYAHERLKDIPGLKIYGTAPGKGRDSLVWPGWPASARYRDRDRPQRNCRARRPPLRAAAYGAPRRQRHMPGVVRYVQHHGRG